MIHHIDDGIWTADGGKDRAAAARCLERILAFDCRRVIMAHGEILEEDVRPTLERAWTWMRAGRST